MVKLKRRDHMTKTLPKGLTSYDLLKTLAIILMIIDHTGHHFYPDEMWFRVFGRLCLPIWFFLIGYARTTEISARLWVGGIIVTLSALVAGQFLLPLNILFTIIALRFLRRGVVLSSLSSAEGLRGMFFILIFLTFPSSILFEYGSSAMLFVLVGYIVRHKEEVSKQIDLRYLKLFTVLSFLSFFAIQVIILPSLSFQQILTMFAGFGFIGIILWYFRPVVYSDGLSFFKKPLVVLVQFAGRRTLEIYVVHILIFRGMCMYLYPERYDFLAWHYVPSNVVSAFM